MRVVIDANLIAALVLPLPYAEQATRMIGDWQRTGVELLAPTLLGYEVAAILRKAVTAGWLTTDLAVEVVGEIEALDLHSVPPTVELHGRALRWAERLGQSKTYDAHYVALAEQEGCVLWTADRRLARGAQEVGAHWVRWMGEVEDVASERDGDL